MSYRTKVYKDKRTGFWYCSYFMPYSGFLRSGAYTTWEAAWEDAEDVERAKEWS